MLLHGGSHPTKASSACLSLRSGSWAGPRPVPSTQYPILSTQYPVANTHYPNTQDQIPKNILTVQMLGQLSACFGSKTS